MQLSNGSLKWSTNVQKEPWETTSLSSWEISRQCTRIKVLVLRICLFLAASFSQTGCCLECGGTHKLFSKTCQKLKSDHNLGDQQNQHKLILMTHTNVNNPLDSSKTNAEKTSYNFHTFSFCPKFDEGLHIRRWGGGCIFPKLMPELIKLHHWQHRRMPLVWDCHFIWGDGGEAYNSILPLFIENIQSNAMKKATLCDQWKLEEAKIHQSRCCQTLSLAHSFEKEIHICIGKII